MRHWLVAVSALAATSCHDQATAPAGVHIDITALQRAAQTAQITVSKVGLLAIQGAAVDPTTAQQMVQTASGASASTTTVDPTSGDQSGKTNDVPVTGGSDSSTTGGAPNITATLGGSANAGGARGTDTTTTSATSDASATGGASATSGAAVQSPKAVPADGVIASVAAGGATGTDIPKFGYYPVAISPTDMSFDVAIPSGHNQTLVFLAFVTDPASGRDDPVYIGEKTAVDLKSTDTVQLNFDIYAAGTVRPEILAPSTLGLTDGSGNAVTAVPSLNCLAVATSSDARVGFPSTTASRVVVGALASLNAVQIATGALILPVGDWGLDCTANFAGHLFGVSADRPLVVTVAQGQVYAPSAPLVVVKDLPAADSGGSSTGGSAGATTGVTTSTSGGGGAHAKAPRLALNVGPLSDATLARGGATTGGSSGITTGSLQGGPVGQATGGALGGGSPGSEGNLTSLADQDVAIVALDDTGAVDPTFNGVVRLTVLTLSATEVFPLDWQPFDTNHQSVTPRSADVAVTNGDATFSGLLQTTTLPSDQLTHHLLIIAQALDAGGNPLDPTGAMAITVRDDTLCSDAVAQAAGVGAITAFTLSATPNTVTADLDTSGNYTEPTVPLVIVVSAGDATDCIINATADATLVFTDISPAGVLDEPNPSFIASDGGFIVPLPLTGNGQWLYWDAFAVAAKFLSTQTPALGASTFVNLPYVGPNQIVGGLQLNAVVLAAP